MTEQLAFLKSTAQYLAPQFHHAPASNPPNVHRQEDRIIHVLDYEEQIKKLYDKLAEVSAAINSVSNPTAQAILVKRYLGRGSWDEIVNEVHISRSRMFELHNAALAEIENSGLNRTVLDE